MPTHSLPASASFAVATLVLPRWAMLRCAAQPAQQPPSLAATLQVRALPTPFWLSSWGWGCRRGCWRARARGQRTPVARVRVGLTWASRGHQTQAAAAAAATLYQGSNQAEEPRLVIVSHLPTSTDQSTSGLTAASWAPPPLALLVQSPPSCPAPPSARALRLRRLAPEGWAACQRAAACVSGPGAARLPAWLRTLQAVHPPCAGPVSSEMCSRPCARAT